MTTEPNYALVSSYLADHENELIRFIISITGNKEDAKDILQDVCLKLLTSENMIKEQTIKSLFYTTAYRIAVDYWRHDSNRKRYEKTIAQTYNYLSNDPMKLYEARDIQSLIEQHLNGMQALNRKIFHKSELQNQKIEDIAQELHMTYKQVGYHLYHTRREIKIWLKKLLTRKVPHERISDSSATGRYCWRLPVQR